MNARTAARLACTVCTSPACLGYTCEPEPVEVALARLRASIAEREAHLELICKLAAGAQARLDLAIEAGVEERLLITLDLEAARAWAGVERVREFWRCQVSSRLRLERIAAGSLVDARDRVVAA